jgi:hypothetical protein
MLLVERGFARAYTRNGHDWTDRYPGKYYLAHRDAILSRENANRKANPEARRVYEAAWRECNREKLRAYKQAWRAQQERAAGIAAVDFLLINETAARSVL